MVVIGWREMVALPDLGLERVRAKVDTGARTSALHVETQWRFSEGGAPWVGFRVRPYGRDRALVEAHAPILDERRVTDSSGRRDVRVFLRTRAWLAGCERTIEINLSDRRGMLFPMLLGRTAVHGSFIVDPAQSFLHGRRPPVLRTSQ